MSKRDFRIDNSTILVIFVVKIGTMKKWLILFVFAWLSVSGMPTPAAFQNIGLRQGLSNGFVLDMVMDGQGFLWVATEAGLNRIAGQKCTMFTTANSHISHNECAGLYYDKGSNSLWIHYKEGGLDVFDCKTQQFVPFGFAPGRYRGSVSDISGAADGGIWIAYNKGTLQHYDTKSRTFRTISNKIFPKARLGVRCVYDDGHDNLYIGLRINGLYTYNLRTHRVRYYKHREGDPTSLPGDNVRCVYQDHTGNTWLGTNMGLALMDKTNGTFRVFKHDANDPTSLVSDNIHGITELSNYQLWIASDVGGIGILDLDRFTTPAFGPVAFSSMVKENSMLSSNNTRRIIQDQYGNIWISNYSTGIDFIPGNGTVFHTLTINGKTLENVLATFFDREGNLWIGQDNKICKIKDGKIMGAWDFAGLLSTSFGSVYVIAEDHEGSIWLGTNDNGVLRFNPKTHLFWRFPYGRQLDFHAIFVDKQGKVWLGSENGLYSYYKGVSKQETEINRNFGSKSPVTIYSIVADKNGRLWMGCNGKGVFVVNRVGKAVARLSRKTHFPSELVNHIFADNDGGMWIATAQGLIYIQDAQRPYNFKVYNERQGLRENHLRAIVQDRNGNIWTSMFSGIACFDVHNQRFYNYDYKSGIPTGNFVEGAAAIAPDGTLFFGSPGGVCFFNPQLLSQQRNVSQVEIIGCERPGSPSQQSVGSIIPYTDKGAVRLNHDDNTFKIAFTVRDFSQTGDVEYSYMMKGLDDKWYETEGDDEVTFRNLPPGHYTFILRAKLRNQDWNEASRAEMKVVVNPPLWLTWWAKLLYALLVMTLVWYLFRSYRQRLLLRNSLAQKEWENEQKQRLNDERLRFYTNITHELRTPLTLILGPLEDIIGDNRLPGALKKRIEGIQVSAERLLALINDLLEFRKTETQNRRLSVAKDDLGELVKEIGMRYHDLNTNSKVEIRVEIDPDVKPLYFDSEVITTVISNFMSNAIKYTPEGSVTLSLSVDPKEAPHESLSPDEGQCQNEARRVNSKHPTVEIAVTDTGYGISKKALPHICDRYYQAGDMHQASGTGIGLALVKSLAELHEARLSVESEEGRGSRFAFILNADNTYPDALHKDETINKDVGVENAGSCCEGGQQVEMAEVDKNNATPLLLIVEDNADIRQYIAESLSEDYRIVQACNGREGRDKAIDTTPDLIVSDIMMPEMDGIEMTKVLKADIRTSHIPVVLLTAKTGNDNQLEGYDSGADSYLTKPFSARLLQSRIRNILASRRRLAEYIAQQSLRSFNNNMVGKVDSSPQDSKMINSISNLDREFLDKLDNLIAENMSTETLDIAFFTEHLYMSHSTLYRKVKALTGMNVNEYVKKAKLSRAMTLLKGGEYTVTEIASLTGFNNLGNFRESFKGEYGVTPSEVTGKHKSYC